jgi:AcrR family transcriptional regulator
MMRTTQFTRTLDRRQRKTRTAIQNALRSLLREKSIDSITISELTELADVNRKTFYNHYSNLQQVRSELEQQYIDLFFSYIREAPDENNNGDPTWFIHCLVQSIWAQPERARLIFESGEHIHLAQRFKELSIPYLKVMVNRYSLHANYLDMAVEYIVNGLVALLNQWVHSKPQMPPEEFEQVATSLAYSSAKMLGFPGSQKKQEA